MNQHILITKYRETRSKYYKYKYKLNRKAASGHLHLLSSRQKHHLLRLVDKFKRRLAHLEQLLKATAAGGALSLTLHYATPVFAQTSPNEVFQVSPQDEGDYASSNIATDKDGNFVIVWDGENQDSETGLDIYARRYARDGTPQGDQILVNTTVEGNQQHAGIDMDEEGNFVVAWEHENPLDVNENNVDVYARRFGADGTPLDEDFPVEGSVEHTANHPTVALNNDGDAFFAWEALLQDQYIRAQIYPADASPLEMLVVSDATGNDASDRDSWPQASSDADGDFWLTFSRVYGDIYAVNYRADNTTPFENGPVDISASLEETEALQSLSSPEHNYPSITSAPDGGFYTSWSINGNQFIAARWSEVAALIENSNLFGDSGSSPRSSIGYGDNEQINVSWTSWDAVQVTTLSPSLDEVINTKEIPNETDGTINGSDMSVYGQGSYVVSWDISRETQQIPVGEIFAARFLPYIPSLEGSEEQFVNDTVVGFSQRHPAVAGIPDGDFVVTWLDDGSPSHIKAKRYNNEGDPVSEELIIHQFDTNGQSTEPDIAMDAEGGFVITWHTRIINEGTYFVRYDNENNPLDEQPVNFGVGASHQYPRVAMDNDGDFSIAWEKEGENGYSSISLQRFDNEGNEAFNESIPVAEHQDFSSQNRPAVVIDEDGDIIVAWNETYIESREYTIHVRRFNEDGTPSSEPILIEDETYPYNRQTDVQIDPDGDVLISWLGNNDGGYLEGTVMTKRYTPDLGNSEETLTGNDISLYERTPPTMRPRIVFDEGGDYTVTSTKYNLSNGEESIIIQRYTKNDTPVGEEVTVNRSASGRRGFADQAAIGNGASVTVWQDDEGGEVANIKMRRFSFPEPPELSTEYPEELVLIEGDQDTLRFALNTIPAEPVQLTLTPDNEDIDLGSGPGIPHTITFQPDERALEWQEVNILAVNREENLGERNVNISFEAASEDPRFTQDVLAPSMPPVTVTVRDAEENPDRPPITIYNAISPDGDGKNEFLFIENIEQYENNRVYIYNRWGDMIAEFKDYDNQTNHWKPGQNVQAGSYHVVVTLGEPTDNITAYIVVKNN